MTVLDAHAHLWRRDRTPQPWIDPESMAAIDRDFRVEDLAAAQAEAGIDGSIVVQSSNSSQETADLLIAADGVTVRGVIGWLDLECDVDDQLGEIAALPGGSQLVGIRHLAHQDRDPDWLSRAAVARGLDALGRAAVPFDLVVRPDQLASAARVVREHPGTTFVLDHLGKPPLASGELAHWERDLGRLASTPNVVAKLSGLAIEADWGNWSVDTLRRPVGAALAAFGPERLLFGSDWPLVLLTGGPRRWRETVDALLVGLSTGERSRIMGGTAVSLYTTDRDA